MTDDVPIQEQAHWCPWHNKPVVFVKMDEEMGPVSRCQDCGSQYHEDNTHNFCWCDK